MTILKQAALTIMVGAICFSAGKFSTPAKIETKEVEKIVYKERTDTTKKTDKKETIHPDGTRVIETVTETKRTKDKSADIETKKETATTNRKDWLVTIGYAPATYAKSEQSYSLSIQRRMFSEVYLGAYVTTEKTIGLTIGVGF